MASALARVECQLAAKKKPPYGGSKLFVF